MNVPNTNEIKILFPHCYHSLALDNKTLLAKYVKGFLKSSFPEYKPLRIEGNYAICVHKEK